jgi:hypothetical protein
MAVPSACRSCVGWALKIVDDQDQQMEACKHHYTPPPIPAALQWRTWAANPEGKDRRRPQPPLSTANCSQG